MLSDWNNGKSDRCLRERGFDFAFAALLFEGETVEFVDDRRDYGEARIIAFGLIDRAKVDATTEEDTRRYLIEDGFDPDDPLKGFREIVQVATLRKRTGLSQEALAKALGIPVGTIRNWEQGRTPPDPAARALLALVADDPERAFKVLAA